MNIDIFRKGNIIRYFGEYKNYHKAIGIIESICDHSNLEVFTIKIKINEPGDLDYQTKAYLTELESVPLYSDFLLKNDFHFDEIKKYYKRGNLEIYHFAFIEESITANGRHNSQLDDIGFVIKNQIINNYNDKIEVKAKTISLASINSLQNYYEVVLNEKVYWKY